MQYILKSEEMKDCDADTTDRIGIPSVVLMERAALCVSEELSGRAGIIPKRILVAAGRGNNGGDGLAAGRLLALMGHAVTFFLVGKRERLTPQTRAQIEIIENLGFSIQSNLEEKEYDMVIDALLGIGLSGNVREDYARVIGQINRFGERGAFVCSVDIPSGISADTGAVMGCAVRADLTVTFAFAKRGHLLYPGKEYSGRLTIRDIGITERSFSAGEPAAFCLEEKDIPSLLPRRRPDGNKGTFGKVLLAAGSRDMAGACILCAEAVLRAGAGMVKIITPACNRQILQQSLPEAMLYTFEDAPEEAQVQRALDWCDAVVAGPGLGKSEGAALLMRYLLKNRNLPMVLDADGLNLIAGEKKLAEMAAQRQKGKTVLTPHPGELLRILGSGWKDYETQREQLMVTLAQRFHCIVASKDAATMVVQDEGEKIYMNSSGNDALATAGSGDVLAGITGSLLAQGMKGFEGACLAVYLHGLAGERAGGKNGRRGVTASDVIRELMQVMNERKQEGNGHVGKLPEGICANKP